MNLKFSFDDDCANTDVVAALRRAGIEARVPEDVGMRGARDEDHLALAATGDWTFVTANRKDFMQLHTQWLRAGKSHPGIVFLEQQALPVREEIRRLVKIHQRFDSEAMRDWYVYLSAIDQLP